MTTQADVFNAEWRPILEPLAKKYNIPIDFMLTQLAQESQWGLKTPKDSNNYGGVKDFRKKSDGVMAKDAGRLSKFRKFDSKEQFAEHWVNMLSRLYPKVQGATTIEEYASALQDGKRRYAESPHYKDDLATVHKDHYANNSNQTVEQIFGLGNNGGISYPVHNAGVGMAQVMADAEKEGLYYPDIAKLKQDDIETKDPYLELYKQVNVQNNSGTISPSIASVPNWHNTSFKWVE